MISPILEAHPESPHSHNKDITPEIPRSLGAPCQESWTKMRQILYYSTVGFGRLTILVSSVDRQEWFFSDEI